MSPGQARGESAALATTTDVYGLGVILFDIADGARSIERVQRIASPAPYYAVSAGTEIFIPFSYETLDRSHTTGLHLRVHYDSSRLTFVRELETFGNVPASAELKLDGPYEVDGVDRVFAAGLEGDSNTDSYANLLWFDPTGQWDASIATLFVASFVPTAEFSGQIQIRLTGNAAKGYELMPLKFSWVMVSCRRSWDRSSSATEPTNVP